MYAILIQIKSFLFSNSSLLSILCLGIPILFEPEKKQIFARLQHPRNHWDALILLFLLVCLYYITHWLSVYPIRILLAWASYLGIILLFLRRLRPRTFSNYSSWVLRRYYKQLYGGMLSINESFFVPARHWFLGSVPQKLEYNMLRCLFFIFYQQCDKAYQCLQNINPSWLYPQEKLTINHTKAHLLCQMGDLTAAYRLLKTAIEKDSLDPAVWCGWANIAEQQGDLSSALQYVQKAQDCLPMNPKDAKHQAWLANEYGRFTLLNRNPQEALHHYYTAWNLLQKHPSWNLIPPVANNLILQLTYQKRYVEAEEALQTYTNLCAPLPPVNKLGLFNTTVLYHQLRNNLPAVFNVIKDFYFDLKPHLSPVQLAHLKANVFHTLLNAHLVHDWLDAEICAQESVYQALPLMDRLAIFEKYMSVFVDATLKVVRLQQPYAGLFQVITNYYNQSALRNIDDGFQTCQQFNIAQYAFFMQQKIRILQLQQKENHLTYTQPLYESLYHTFQTKGSYVSATQTLCALVDECTSPFNTQVYLPGQPPLWLYQAMQKMPPSPTQGAHPFTLYYATFQFSAPTKFIYPHQDIILKYLPLISQEIEKWQDHPAKVDIALRLAGIYAALGDKSSAQKFYSQYKSFGLSDWMLSSSARENIRFLEWCLKPNRVLY